jgi:hypothetical protein
MPALIPAVVATSVRVSPWPSRTRRATAPSCRPTFGPAVALTPLVASTAELDFLEKRATRGLF